MSTYSPEFYEVPTDTDQHTTGFTGSKAGFSVAIAGNSRTMIVGAPIDSGFVGQAFAYSRVGHTWTLDQVINPTSMSGTYSLFGYSIAISEDGNTAAIGGPKDSATAIGGETATDGAVWVFRYSGGAWTFDQKITARRGNTRSGLGFRVDISPDGSRIIAGEPQTHNAAGTKAFFGAVNIYEYTGTWGLMDTIEPSDFSGTGAGLAFGTAVAFATNDRVLIGATGDNSGDGAVWAYEYISGTWTNVDKFSGPTSFALGTDISACATRFIASTVNPSQGWIYKDVAGTWTFETAIDTPSPHTTVAIPVSINKSGKRVAIGDGVFIENIWAITPLNLGAVDIYDYSALTDDWNLFQNIVPSEIEAQSGVAAFEIDLDGPGRRINFGGPGQSNQRGAVWVWRAPVSFSLDGIFFPNTGVSPT